MLWRSRYAGESLASIEKQKHDKRRRPFGTLKAGDLVWLNSQDVSVPAKQFLKPRKLTPRYFGPYTEMFLIWGGEAQLALLIL